MKSLITFFLVLLTLTSCSTIDNRAIYKGPEKQIPQSTEEREKCYQNEMIFYQSNKNDPYKTNFFLQSNFRNILTKDTFFSGDKKIDMRLVPETNISIDQLFANDITASSEYKRGKKLQPFLNASETFLGLTALGTFVPCIIIGVLEYYNPLVNDNQRNKNEDIIEGCKSFSFSFIIPFAISAITTLNLKYLENKHFNLAADSYNSFLKLYYSLTI